MVNCQLSGRVHGIRTSPFVIPNFNAASCDKSALSFLLNSFLPELLKRVTMKQKRPISLFLDESAKLLSENTELNEEILRECEVELVLAFQNEFLLKRAIGGTAYEALMGNLTNRYFMRKPRPRPDP